MTFLELMEIEIRRAGHPLTVGEAFMAAEKDGSINELPKTGKTPHNTMNAQLHKDMKRGEKARFIQVSTKPAKFDIKRK